MGVVPRGRDTTPRSSPFPGAHQIPPRESGFDHARFVVQAMRVPGSSAVDNSGVVRLIIHVAINRDNALTAAVSCSAVSGSDSTPTTRTGPESGLTRGSGMRES